MPREILVDWTTQNGAGKVSVFNFIEASAVADQREALSDFLEVVDSYLDNSSSWTIRTNGREMDATTGALTGVWAEGTAQTGTGAGTGEPAADATQLLVRWITDHIVGGRFLQGRNFFPGLATTQLSNGNFAAAGVTAVSAAAQALCDAAVQMAVWHRPVGGAGGVLWGADVGVCNSELAVLRRRRD